LSVLIVASSTITTSAFLLRLVRQNSHLPNKNTVLAQRKMASFVLGSLQEVVVVIAVVVVVVVVVKNNKHSQKKQEKYKLKI
jgi:hypothetical protein